MSYSKTTWKTGDTITAQLLNHAEDGIAANDAAIAAIPAGLQLYGPYYAMGGQQSVASGAQASFDLTALEDENGATVNYPSSEAFLIIQAVQVGFGSDSIPAAIKQFQMPYYMGGWQDGTIYMDNTTDSAANAQGMITFYSTVEFPQES